MSWLSNAPRQPKPKVEPPVSIPVPDQRELVFHDKVPIEEEKLPQAREKARAQKEKVLEFFGAHYPQNFTPYEVFEQMKDKGACAILTSIRRSITDLTKEGRLYKCMYSESRKGQYGALNRVWKYNPDWMPPLNPKK